MNTDRDYPNVEAEHLVKKLALAAAEAYHAGTEEQTEQAERVLLAACLLYGLLTPEEHSNVEYVGYDGAQAENGEHYHWVFVNLPNESTSVLAIKCDQ